MEGNDSRCVVFRNSGLDVFGMKVCAPDWEGAVAVPKMVFFLSPGLSIRAAIEEKNSEF
jgi:hypothetical protein